MNASNNYQKKVIAVTEHNSGKDGLKNTIVKGAIGSLFLQVGFAGFAFLNAIILARTIGPEGYGAFANGMAWVSLLNIPASFGFGILLVRDISVYRFQKKWGLFKGLLQFSELFVVISSIVLAVTAALFAGWIFSSLEDTNVRRTLWVSLVLLPLFALYNLKEGCLRGLEHVVMAKLPIMIIRPGLLMIGILLLQQFLPDSLVAPIAMVVNVGAGIATLIVGIFF